jgi:hypothetical protein
VARTTPEMVERVGRGVGSLPASNQLATFVPATDADKALFYDALSAPIREDVPVEDRNAYAYGRTGVFPAPFANDQLVREISDAGARLRDDVLQSGESRFLLSDILDHPELFDLYPELGDITVVMDETLPPQTGGAFSAIERAMVLNPNQPEGMSMLKTILHEGAGHGVQALTGMPSGSNEPTARGVSSMILEDYPVFKNVDLPVDPMSLYDIYLSSGGEAAARLLERRSDMAEEELRRNYPLDMLDVSPESIEFLRPYYERLDRDRR